MKKLFLALVAMFAITAVASAANYTADDAAIDAAIENAIEVDPFQIHLSHYMLSASHFQNRSLPDVQP